MLRLLKFKLHFEFWHFVSFIVLKSAKLLNIIIGVLVQTGFKFFILNLIEFYWLRSCEMASELRWCFRLLLFLLVTYSMFTLSNYIMRLNIPYFWKFIYICRFVGLHIKLTNSNRTLFIIAFVFSLISH